VSEPMWCEIRQNYCRCQDYASRCEADVVEQVQPTTRGHFLFGYLSEFVAHHREKDFTPTLQDLDRIEEAAALSDAYPRLIAALELAYANLVVLEAALHGANRGRTVSHRDFYCKSHKREDEL
jgi:hypothetical protein